MGARKVPCGIVSHTQNQRTQCVTVTGRKRSSLWKSASYKYVKNNQKRKKPEKTVHYVLVRSGLENTKEEKKNERKLRKLLGNF